MSTVCCLSMPSNHHSLTSPSFLLNSNNNNNNREEQQKEVQVEEEDNYSIILNQHLPSVTSSNNLPMSTRCLQQQPQQQPLLLVAEEAEILETDNQNDNDKLLLPRSTRSLKRRLSLFEKSRDWARRLITLHRIRRNTISNEKIHETCFEINKKYSTRKTSFPDSLHNYQKSFDEDGYLSPMEIKAKLDNISQEKQQSLSKLSINPDQQLLVYSHSSSDLSQTVYRCHGPVIKTSTSQCTCQQPQQRLVPTSVVSEYHKSLSVVDYIDFDVSDESSSLTKQDEDDDGDDPIRCLKYLFDENNKQQQQQNINFIRRTPRRSTNTSSISADSGYSDIPTASSKFIPVHLISCTLIPVNVTRPESMDIRCLTCTCPPSSSSSISTYFSTKTEHRRRRQRKFSTHSQPHRTYSRQHMDIIENEINKQCSCNNKYYSTMTICPTLSLSSPMGTKSITKIDGNQKDDYIYKQQQEQKKQLRKKRASLLKLPTITDDLTSVSRWFKPNLERDAIYHVLQTADYGAFILRNSTTHPDCYALSVKVPKFTHESNIAHYLIEKIFKNNNSTYRIKGTIKQFPTLLSLLTHHSVMPEILPITLNLNEVLPI